MSQAVLFKSNLSKKPYCTDYFGYGLQIRSAEIALKKRYIQPNHPNSKLWLIYDIDRGITPDDITDDLLLPAPHFFVQNPVNQRAHVYYGLETAIHLNPTSSRAAIRYAAAVDIAMTTALGADTAYAGLIAKNPMHSDWRVWTSDIDQYDLDELSGYLDLSPYANRSKPLPEIGLGRNCGLFDRLREWSYKAIRQGWPDHKQFLRACEDRAIGYNAGLETPLDHKELGHIAKSVAKYTHARFSESQFLEIQTKRGAKGGKAKGKAYASKKSEALEMLSKGVKQSVIAATLEVSTRTIRNWKSGK